MKVQMKLDTSRINVKGTDEKVIEYNFTEQEIIALYNFMIEEKKKRNEQAKKEAEESQFYGKETGGSFKKTYNKSSGKYEYVFEYDDESNESDYFSGKNYDGFFKDHFKEGFFKDAKGNNEKAKTSSSSNSSVPKCYLDLGLKYPSTKAEVTAAFRKLVLKCHPDKDKSHGAAERFERAKKARDECMKTAT